MKSARQYLRQWVVPPGPRPKTVFLRRTISKCFRSPAAPFAVDRRYRCELPGASHATKGQCRELVTEVSMNIDMHVPAMMGAAGLYPVVGVRQ